MPYAGDFSLQERKDLNVRRQRLCRDWGVIRFAQGNVHQLQCAAAAVITALDEEGVGLLGADCSEHGAMVLALHWDRTFAVLQYCECPVPM